jgi:hypothetical protein
MKANILNREILMINFWGVCTRASAGIDNLRREINDVDSSLAETKICLSYNPFANLESFRSLFRGGNVGINNKWEYLQVLELTPNSIIFKNFKDEEIVEGSLFGGIKYELLKAKKD